MLAIYLILILGALALLSGSIAGISLVIEVNRLKKRVEMLEKNGKTQESSNFWNRYNETKPK